MKKDQQLRAFEQYVSAYDANDPKIRLKIEHSFRVADLSEGIAETVDGADREFAWTIGLLHDIGRFEQVRRYHTFVDADSVDHAQLGADLLFQEGLISEFTGNSLDMERQRLMETAIRGHNAYRLPEGLTEEERCFCDILRDADKIDIFRVMCETSLEKIFDAETEELRASGVSDGVKECFLGRRAVPREVRKTLADKTVSHLCLVFELVYPVSRKIAKGQGYVDRLLEFPSDNGDTRAWFAYMRDHIWT